MQKIAIALIKFYKYAISPYINKGARCKFYPTCSEYAILAIKKYGFFIGIIKSIVRILRCNPFTKDKVDLP
ncbi:MAG: membrane protein insertion efficiency factor YidD [Alphaproteobacteria bacterium]|nr:membrane protein insertion efficiency factor YidD [Alphaproteobacteria bacterium]